MQRQQPKFSNIANWWDYYRQAHEPSQLVELDRALTPLLDAAGADDEILPALALLADLNADPHCLAVYCDYVGHPGEGSPQLDLTHQLKEIDRLEAACDPTATADEGLRRLLMALVKDVRVVLVVLVDRLMRLRRLTKATAEEQAAYASVIQSIHAPLANRLGIWQLKWELEDLVFRFTEPALYQRIAALLNEKRLDRERYIRRFIDQVQTELKGAGLNADVVGRPKHIYSIWRKMQRKGLAFAELHDVRAVRVLVDDVPQCYTALGIVHALWRPVAGEFDDYVANPKGNNYQSLHTAVFGPEGKTVEIQIRTHEMHHHAELGVAAHWRYKEGGDHDPGYQRKVNWMRQLLEGGADEAGVLEDFGVEGAEDRVYVLTPKGKVVDLRRGATVLDFAYQVHTSVGNRCRGAKVNGRIVPLTHVVANGEQIEILTGKLEDPSRDWLVPRLGYLHSARARAKVRQWFRQKDKDRNVAEGREVVDKELRRLAARAVDLEPLVSRFNFKDLDGLYAAVAIGEVTVGQIAAALEELNRPDDDDVLPLVKSPQPDRRRTSDDLIIEGVGNLMTVIARCCSPLPGDPIIGFITQTRGVSIHRRDCRNVDRLVRTDPARMLDVSWGDETKGQYQAEIRVSAYDRKGLLRDIGQLTSTLRSEMLSFNSNVDPARGEAEIHMTVRVSDFEHLNDLLSRLTALPNVTSARRTG
ncbi:MAG: bifunctional (p)ppGpp synthetase/guanosine-3',5'-bis(diphosphate) 3'-pyrophosphohydrolase [Pseudomonadota bacterium]